MLLMGDEVRRTQQGNNNAYCQDNEISWFDWNLCTPNADLLRFVRNMIRVRLNFNEGTGSGQITLEDYLSKARIEWHGIEIGKPDWGNNSHSVAVTLHNIAVSQVRYIAINAYWQPLEFELPPVNGDSDAAWLRLIDTSLPSPNDISEEGKGSSVNGPKYVVNPRSIVMLHYDDAAKDQGTIER
jgi:glycogen operon protein